MNLWGQLAIKALVSGAIIAAASELARRNPGWGGLVASLPMTSLLALIWLWRAHPDPRGASDFLMGSTIYVVASLPAFVAMATLLRRGFGLVPTLAIGAAIGIAGYLLAGALGRQLDWPV